MNIETIDDLFLVEIQQLYEVEQILVTALPKMANGSSSGRLREALTEHLQQTKEHASRLRRAFEYIGRSAARSTAEGMDGLIAEGNRLLEEMEQSPLRDAGLIAAASRVEHYEISAYSCAIRFAELLGHMQIARLLSQTLDEEKQTDARLTRIAEEAVNQEAVQLGAHQRT